jgi:hypothetical protein
VNAETKKALSGRVALVTGRSVDRTSFEPRSGLIVNISCGAARKHIANVAYGVSELSLYPGLVRTESVMAVAARADKYGYTDVDGKRPRPLTLEDV